MIWLIVWCAPPYIPKSNDAWHLFGVGIGQGEIIGFGLIAGVVGVAAYRFFTRGKRYGRGPDQRHAFA